MLAQISQNEYAALPSQDVTDVPGQGGEKGSLEGWLQQDKIQIFLPEK